MSATLKGHDSSLENFALIGMILQDVDRQQDDAVSYTAITVCFRLFTRLKEARYIYELWQFVISRQTNDINACNDCDNCLKSQF